MTLVAFLPGDGIGPEVLASARRVLERLVPSVELVEGLVGREALRAHRQPIAPDTATQVRDADAVLFGATETRPGEPSAVLALRALTGARCNIRPARARLPGARPCDVTVYRELTEDLYVQDEEVPRGGIAIAHRRITADATQRFAELALEHADPGVPLIVAHKATVLPRTDGLFLATCEAIAAKRGRTVTPRLVDSLAHDLVRDPAGPLAVLAPNMYGDILSDVTAALAGGLGLAPSLTVGDGPAIAEPVHGSAPDIAGKDLANPTATLTSCALLLDHLGHEAEAQRLDRALDHVLADRSAGTPDIGGKATTTRFTDAVLASLKEVSP